MKWLLTLFLLLTPVLLFADGIKDAKQLTLKAEYQESLVALEKVKMTDENYNEYCYLKAVNHYSLNQQKEAEYWIDKLLGSFSPSEIPDMPRRYYELCRLMKYDMETWQKKPDDLDDISREMKVITDRLKNSKGGKDTQKKQKEVLARLDKMIKDKEDALNKAQKEQEEKDKKEAEDQYEKAREVTLSRFPSDGFTYS